MSPFPSRNSDFIPRTWCKRLQNCHTCCSSSRTRFVAYVGGSGWGVERFESFMGPSSFGSFKIKSPTISLFRGCIRLCFEQKRQKARSGNIMSKMTLVTGELIPISSFHCNASDRGFLEFWQLLFFFFTFGKCQGKLFLPKVSCEQLKTLTPVLSALPLHPNILHSGLTLSHTLIQTWNSQDWTVSSSSQRSVFWQSDDLCKKRGKRHQSQTFNSQWPSGFINSHPSFFLLQHP